MKTQYLVVGFVAAALFASTPDASAHGGSGHGGGNWAGRGGGNWAGHGQASGFMGMAIPCCGIGITRIILTLSTPMMTGIMAIRITRTVILLPLPNGSRPHSRGADIITARLTAK